MKDFLSVIKLKDKFTIISLMLVFAVALAVAIGFISAATVDVHKHIYEHYLMPTEDGGFEFISVCTDTSCTDRFYSQSVDPSVVRTTESVIPTCCNDGLTIYSVDYQGITYTHRKTIPALAHNYEGSVSVSEDGKISVQAICKNEECSSKNLSIENSSDVEILPIESEWKEATCYSPRYEKYSITQDGKVDYIVCTIQENIPHTLNGVFVSEYMKAGSFVYGVDGVTLDGDGVLGCGERGTGRYVCEVCLKEQTVEVFRDDHKLEYVDGETVLPTDNSPGKAVVKCSEEDCDFIQTLLLPKVVIGSNAVVISQDQDKEQQTVLYTYVDSTYKFTVEAEIVVSWANHVYEYDEDSIVYPTLTSEGSVVLKCKNSVCNREVIVIIPKMTVGENTEIVSDHILEKQTYNYTYTDAVYGFTITHSIEKSWIDHSYVYVEGETVRPSFDSKGKAYVRCSYEGCDKYHEISLPEILMGTNAKIVSDATELAASTARYTYTDKDYDFTVSFDFSVGEPLTHQYEYKLEFTVFGYDFVGYCNQPGCQTPEIREQNVTVAMEDHPATCTEDGYLIARYERDGVVYEHRMRMGTHTGHNYVQVDMKHPTFAKDGSVKLVCDNEGCNESADIILPMMVFGTNTEIVSDATELSPAMAKYIYVNEQYGWELILDIPIGSALQHEYHYSLVYNEASGNYDFVGYCNQPGCQTPEIIEENVDAIVEEHKVSCTEDGYVYVKYERDGIIYELTFTTGAHTGHNYNTEAPTSLIKPTWTADGSAVIGCTNEGCTHTVTVNLPKINPGVNTFYLNEDDNQMYYIYNDEETGYELFFLI